MKRTAILTTIVVTGMAAAGVMAQQAPRPGGRPMIPPTGKIEKITDNLYKIPGAGGNTTVFIKADGVVLVDTKLANNGQQILDQVRTVTDKPVTMVINTHTHPDHNGSNDFFKAASPTVEIVAHANTAKWVAANPRAVPAMKPDKTFTDKMTIGKGKDQIDLYWFGPGHTDGDAFVVFPSAKAMNVGDLMAWNMGPLIDPASGGSMVALPGTLEKAIKGIKGVDKVIEGHGHVNTWAGFVLYTQFHRDLVNETKAAIAKGLWPEDAVAALEKKDKRYAVFFGDQTLEGMEYGGTPRSRNLINANVAFQELKGEKVTTNFGQPLPRPGQPAPTPPAPPPGN